jgi:histidinol-phosphate aminotransferase
MTGGSVRAHVRDLQPVAHGSVSARELAAFGLMPGDALDFSVNTNPLGPAPNVVRAIQQTDWTRYPGDDEMPLRQGLAGQTGARADQVVLGNGSAELMWLIGLAVLEPGDPVAIVGPTFGEYARAVRAVGACPIDVRSPSDVPACRMVFVCNPNNPTGSLVSRDTIARLLSHAPRLLVLDEAYASFAPQRWPSEPLQDQHPNLLILRSLTKDHALPGLRLGYLLAAPELAAAVEAVRPPWSVNAGALRAGLATLDPAAQAHLARARDVVAEARSLLTAGFRHLGYAVEPSSANFVLVEVGDAPAFRRALLPRGLVVRDCTSFGLPSHVRVACRTPAECTRLLEVVKTLN